MRWSCAGDQSVSPLWVEDCSAAAVIMQYAAQGLGLGSRWAHMKWNDLDETTTSRQYIADLPSCCRGGYQRYMY